MPFGLGFGETILILAIVLIFFGPRRMPEMGASLGKGIRDFKRALNGLSAELQDGGTPTIHQQPFAAPPAPAVVAAPPAHYAEGTVVAPETPAGAVVDSVTAPVGQVAADHPTLQRTLHDAPLADPAAHAVQAPAGLEPVAADAHSSTGGTPTV